jgi:UDP-glucose:(heptosyl)LPS alpha-1,3-glucosyltransferase
LTFHSAHAAWLDVSVAGEAPGSPRAIAKRLYPFHRAAIAMEAHQVRHHRGMIHACSAAVREEVIRYYHADPDRVVAVPWGVDLDVFKPDPVVGRAKRAEWGIPKGATVLLLMANEFHRKGLKPCLEALALLGRKDLHLTVAGRGDPQPYRSLIETLGVGPQVHFLGSQEAAPCYQAADVFVMPSTYEGWGLVVPEALACGLPNVVSRFPASDELVTPGVNGEILEDATDAQELAAALERVLAPGVRERMARSARPSVAHYAWPEVSRRILALGEQGVARRRAIG